MITVDRRTMMREFLCCIFMAVATILVVLPSTTLALQLQLPPPAQQSRREYFGDVLMGGIGLATSSASFVPPAYADSAKVSTPG